MIAEKYILPLRKVKLPRLPQIRKYFEKIDVNSVYSNNGPLVLELREALAKKYNLDTELVTVTSSGTKSLQTILQQLVNRRKAKTPFQKTYSEELYCILPSYTFVASAMAILGAGLKPIFIDIEENTGQLSASSAEQFLDNWKLERSKIVAVMPVSPFGAKIDKEIWSEFSSKHKLEVVYDEAWCFDSFIPNSKGASALSLHATKSFGCGEGGVIFSSNYEKSQEYHQVINFGLDNRRISQCVGTNGKMSEYQAAVALAALDGWLDNRNKCLSLQDYYLEKLSSLSSLRPLHGFDNSWAWGTLPVVFDKEQDLEALIKAAKTEKIEMRRWWNTGVQQFPSMRGYLYGDLGNTRILARKLINVPFFPEMNFQDVDLVCNLLKKFES